MADAPSHRDAAKGRLPTLKGTLTHAHLRDAFALDARAASLYGYFARIAEIEGYPEVASTLRELAEQKAMFADGHLDFLKKAGEPLTGRSIGETVRNIEAAVLIEAQDAADRLPAHARTAHAEGFPDIASWFESVALARHHHHARLQSAKEDAR
ncbi:MAG: rubrerythrin [Deltaproteobacteria bacterium]|nr:rubrerythrin [Deltaproteobacteria bacterium]HCH61404.1 rubrerythrin [Deltaproteobacteria bacterium]